MTKSFNRNAVYAVFNLADKSSASFTEKLLEQGIASRAEATPFAMEWASEKYEAKLKDGQRGKTFVKRNTDAERAMNRVLSVCYPKADAPKPKSPKRSANKTDAVAKLLKAYTALTAVEKRRFLKSI
jgi:nucleoid-associated protein YgaU